MADFTVLTYERVSTDDQALTKSCDDQKSVNDRYIDSQGWELADNADYRDEGISGSTVDRPGLQDLLIRCTEDKSIVAIVVTESDRLARGNLAYLFIRESLKKCGVKVVAVTQPMIDDSDEGEMIGEIMGAVNGFLSKITRRKSMRALDEKAARGWWPGMAPIGYRNVNAGTEEKPDRIIEIDPETSLYVKQIPRLYTQGYSFLEISDKLFEHGLRGKKNGKLSHEEIRRIIYNNFYLGEFLWRGKRYKANHQPLFTWFEIQQARNKAQERSHSHSTKLLREKHLFKRLSFNCVECGRRITAETKRKYYKGTDRNATYELYHCSKSLGGWKGCRQPSINKNVLVNEFAEKAVKPIDIDQELAEFLLEEMDRSYKYHREEHEQVIGNINKRLGQIDTELTNLFEMRIAGSITSIGDKSADQVYEGYKQKKEFERQQLMEAKAKLESGDPQWQEKASNFFSLCCNATNLFLKADEPQQYQFLNRLTSNVLLDDKKLVVTHKFPFSLLVQQGTHPFVQPAVGALRTYFLETQEVFEPVFI